MIRLTGGLARNCGRSTIDSLWMWSPDVRQPSRADRSAGKSTTRRSNPASANLGMAFADVNSQELTRAKVPYRVGIYNVFLNAASYDWPLGVVIRPIRSAIPGRKANCVPSEF
jgi:hypothetical protein